MEVVNFEILKEKIKNYEENSKNNCVSIPMTQESRKEELEKLYKYEEKGQNVNLLKIKTLDDISVLEYELIDTLSCNKTNGIVIIKDNTCIFSMECEETNNNFIRCKKESFSIYDESFNTIYNLCIENGASITNISLLNKRTNEEEVYSKNYSFYHNENGIAALKVDDEKVCFRLDNGFTIGIESANKLIEEVSSKIDRKLDELLGIEKVKQYQIKRHKQG